VKRWLALPVLVAGLVLTLPAGAARRDIDATASLAQVTTGQYRLTVSNTGSTVIMSVVLTAGPALKPSAVTSSNSGTCTLTNATTISCAVALAPPPCPCNPGDLLEVRFAGTGDPGGSVVKLDDVKSITLGTPPTVTPPTPPAAKPPATTPKPTAKKKIPLCKKGQKSTKKKPCRKRR
jgi:hypothetical protein